MGDEKWTQEFDEDIQADLAQGKCFSLACTAQHMRDWMCQVNGRAKIAALKRMRAARRLAAEQET
jgi:hypothetical protein